MNREEVIQLAREAGDDWDHTLPSDRAFLERFAALVEERTLTKQKARYYQEGYDDGVHDEREECAYLAEMCDDVSIAQFIRARGNDVA